MGFEIDKKIPSIGKKMNCKNISNLSGLSILQTILENKIRKTADSFL